MYIFVLYIHTYISVHVCIYMYVWSIEIYKLDLFARPTKLVSQQWHPFEKSLFGSN